ncbi:MAG: MFS transporter [Actinomycetales bacterium]|nr:MFS transporter [Actinomycetales bacterium]
MSRLRERILPRRLGRDFSFLVSSSWVSNIGDGFELAAGPLLVASVTRDPVLVAMAALLQRLPWVLFGLYAGALADRYDRRRIVMGVDLTRAVILAILSATILTGHVQVWIVLVAIFLLGVAETFADTTSSTLLPMVVERADLGIANARLQTGFLTMNQLAGPPIGAALFALGAAVPFVAQAVCVAAGALMVGKMSVGRPRVLSQEPPRRVREDIATGFRWLWGHAAVRTLALTILTFNITFGAAWSVLVLYATDHLGMGEVGFGLLTTISAVGGLLGTASYGWLEQRVALGTIMRGGLIIETLTHLGLALTTSPLVAMVIFFCFGAHAFIWGTTARTVRQRAVPEHIQGRVGSVYMLGMMGGLVVGQALGGPIASTFGLIGPFWFAFGGSAVILALIWRQLPAIAHAPDPAADTPAP